jgi:ATP-dependent Clp protease, protease subunit
MASPGGPRHSARMSQYVIAAANRSSAARSATDTEPEPRPGAWPLVSEHLFAARTILLFGEVSMVLAERVSAELFALAEQSDDPIKLVLHSPGGHVESADTIHDVIRFIRPRVRILGTGWVASAGALIFASVPREDRFALRNTRFLLHQPLGGVSGPTSDVEIEARQILSMRQRINHLLSQATGQSMVKITTDTERNHWMNAEEAQGYGLLGRILRDASEFA